jgi:hypothetical protein
MNTAVIQKIGTVGERAYISTVDDFGNVTRPSFLGLQHAPVVLMDDNTLKGFAGHQALTVVVPIDVKQNALSEEIDVPLDVRMVGIAQLTAAGVPTETQALMFDNFRNKLTKEQRAQYSAMWLSASSSSPEEQVAFMQSMVSMLTSL